MLSILTAAPIGARQVQHGTAVVKGQAVAGTKGGEVKPALFAKVYLLDCTDKTEPSGEDICLVYARERLGGAQNDMKRLDSGQIPPDTDEHEILSDRSSLAYTVTARVNEEDLKSVLFSTKTDASGNFEFSKVNRKKSYRIVVFGQAGSYDCNWESDQFTISSTGTTYLTLHKPEACTQIK